jgi:hypothetical protein
MLLFKLNSQLSQAAILCMLVPEMELIKLNISLTIISSVNFQAVNLFNWKYSGEIWKLYTVGT